MSREIIAAFAPNIGRAGTVTNWLICVTIGTAFVILAVPFRVWKGFAICIAAIAALIFALSFWRRKGQNNDL